MRFRYSCVGCPKLRELEYIMDNSREIKHDTFKKNIGTENYKELANSLGYGPKERSSGLTMKTDWSVSFYKSKTPKGQTVYYLCHSSIEYVYY